MVVISELCGRVNSPVPQCSLTVHWFEIKRGASTILLKILKQTLSKSSMLDLPSIAQQNSVGVYRFNRIKSSSEFSKKYSFFLG